VGARNVHDLDPKRVHGAAQKRRQRKYSAVQVLQLATALIKKEISAQELHQLLSRNKFAVTALTSIYKALEKSTPNTKEARRAFAAASGLMSRYSNVASQKSVPRNCCPND
jgi:hypothetical protein